MVSLYTYLLIYYILRLHGFYIYIRYLFIYYILRLRGFCIYVPSHINQHACILQTSHCFPLVTELSDLESSLKELWQIQFHLFCLLSFYLQPVSEIKYYIFIFEKLFTSIHVHLLTYSIIYDSSKFRTKLDLWFHQYLLSTNFCGFYCWDDPQNLMFTEML